MSKQKQQSSNFAQRLGMLACTVVVILAILAGLSYALWCLVVQVEHGILAAWALVMTALLPLVFWAGASWGTRAARGMVEGLHTGVDTVMSAANRTADLKVNVTRAVHPQPLPAMAVLPDVIDITPRQVNGGRDIIV